MSAVTLTVNGKAYAVGCEDGGEDHLRALAEAVDAKARLVAPNAGGPGETRLMLMAALMIADDLQASRLALAAAEARAAALAGQLARLEARAVAALDEAAARLEAMAPD